MCRAQEALLCEGKIGQTTSKDIILKLLALLYQSKIIDKITEEQQMKTTTKDIIVRLLNDITTAEQSGASPQLLVDLIKLELKRLMDEQDILAR